MTNEEAVRQLRATMQWESARSRAQFLAEIAGLRDQLADIRKQLHILRMLDGVARGGINPFERHH